MQITATLLITEKSMLNQMEMKYMVFMEKIWHMKVVLLQQEQLLLIPEQSM